MNVVSFSASASAWLAEMEPDPAWLGPSAPPARPTWDLLITPGESEPDYRAWATSAGATFQPRDPGDGSGEGSVSGVELVWSPQTLKSVMDHALRLARTVDRLAALMSVLSRNEKQLFRLREIIEAYRSRVSVPTAVCLIHDEEWRIGGRWVPDLVDRAGGNALLLESGDAPTTARPGDLIEAGPEYIIAGLDPEQSDGVSTVETLREILRGADFGGSLYLVPEALLVSTGPAVHRAIYVIASALHPHIAELAPYRSMLSSIEPTKSSRT